MRLKKLVIGVLCAVLAVCCLPVVSACQTPSDNSSGNSSTGGGNPPIEPVKIERAPLYSAVDLTGYTTYYFDSANGSDSNNGLSEASPKATLDAAETLAATATAENPVRLLFKRGATFSGNSVFEDYQSTAEKPLIIDAYGDKGFPKFIGYGTDTDILPVMRVKDDNIRIMNLEITGPTAYQAILVQADKGGVMENIVIAGNYVHDINFMWNYPTKPSETSPDDIKVESVCPETRQPQGDKYGRYVYRAYSAICLDNDILTSPSWFENAWIMNNRVENVGKIGINVYNRWNNQLGFGYGYNRYLDDDTSGNNAEKRLGRWPHKNIYVTGNYLSCCGADGLVVSGAEGGFVENNVSYYANYLGRSGYWNASIWIFGSRDIIFQYNEAAYTYMRNDGQDAQGFDIDNACSNITFRYNYAHHNEGGGLLLCNNITSVTQYDASGKSINTLKGAGKWENNRIYNNVFAYNGNIITPTRSAFITIARQANYAYIYNNTVILRDDIYGQSIINTEDKNANAACHDQYYYNNIFYSENNLDAKFTITMMYNYKFENNVFYNVTTDGIETIEKAITDLDPQFEIPANVDGMKQLSVFTPKNAEVFSKGMALTGVTGVEGVLEDILKNKVDSKNYLGAIVG